MNARQLTILKQAGYITGKKLIKEDKSIEDRLTKIEHRLLSLELHSFYCPTCEGFCRGVSQATLVEKNEHCGNYRPIRTNENEAV